MGGTKIASLTGRYEHTFIKLAVPPKKKINDLIPKMEEHGVSPEKFRKWKHNLSPFSKVRFSYACTVSPRSSDPFYIESYCIKWVTTSWTHSRINDKEN